MRVLCLCAAVLLSGCAGEASVLWHGVVVVSPESLSSVQFVDAANPLGLTPIQGARVRACSRTCDGSRPNEEAILTDAQGHWGPIDFVFGGSLLSDTTLVVQVEHGGNVFAYETIYEQTRDPTDGSQWLEFRLAKP